MPDLTNRFDYERHVAEGLAVQLAAQRRRLVAYGVEKLPERPAAEWKRDEEELAAVLLLMLRNPWFASYYYLAGSTGIIATPTQIEAMFREWGSEYATETARQITDNSRDAALAAAALLLTTTSMVPFPGAGDQGVADVQQAEQLRRARQLSDIDSERRIVRGAISTVTDAASAGEFAVADEFNRQEAERVARQRQGGLGGPSLYVEPAKKLAAYWKTERDGRVCPICSPLDGKPESTWGDKFPSGPKAHVGCRCYLEWQVE